METQPTPNAGSPTRQSTIDLDHTEGSIIKSILVMGVPSMLGFGLGNIYELINAFWLSRLGPEPVAAITILGPLLWVVHSTNTAVGSGSVAIISRRYGEKDALQTEMAIKETIVLKWLAALVFGFMGFMLTPFLLNLLGAKDQIFTMGVTFGRIIFIGLGFNFATYSVFTALRGVANPNKAMILMFSLSALNMILDPIMIFGWGIIPPMGVAGAAWATVISYASAFIAGMIIFYSGGANIRLHFRTGQKLRWPVMWTMLKIGLPAAAGQMSFSLARLIIMPMITIFGTGVVAAYGVGQRVSNLGITMLVGIGLGLSALIGHNLGAGKLDRTRKTAYQAIMLCVGLMSAIGVIVFVFAGPIMRIFFAQEPEIIGFGVTLLRIFALSFPFLGLHLMLENVYAGVGENRPSMILNMLHSWGLEIPAVFITTRIFQMDQNAVWMSLTGAEAIAATAFFVYFRNGRWLHVKV
jgi:putative MATE family efflux protein